MSLSHGFELLRTQPIPELNSLARLYRHARTGAELLTLANDDENKVFGITFRTPPVDNTGVAHILEHCVLAGSRKYPLKDPFFQMAKGSFKTYLNASTYPDKTVYPVASTNLKDFYNLVDVYLDAVLHPRLLPETLLQEGWHYELDQPDQPMIFKGVVFNEMKGAYASPDRAMYVAVQRALYPDTTYGVDSGGDPRYIPNLTYAQFKQFHEQYYHPSNSRIFFYGDDPEEQRLLLLDRVLGEFEARLVDSAIRAQPVYATPRRIVEPYAAEGGSGRAQGMLTVNWMLPTTHDYETALTRDLLGHILIGTPAAPLRKALIDSGLGEDLAGFGLMDGLLQPAFSTGLKGIDPASEAAVERLVIHTLQTLVDQGIDRATIEASVNTFEFSLRENNTGSFPRGIALMLRSLRSWLYDGDPLAPLAFEAPLAAIKARLAAGEPIFETLINELLITNSHRVTVALRPDPELNARLAAAERERLDAARAAMGPEDVESLITTTRRLRQLQETPDAPELLAQLPSLSLGDIDRSIKTIPLELGEVQGTPLLYHDLFTNGIVYLDLGLNLHLLPAELLPYVALFGRALTELGTTREDFVALTQRIGRTTGGLWAQDLIASVRDQPRAAAWLLLRGKATTARAGELLAIMRDVLVDLKLDNQERFRQLVLEEKASLEARLPMAGHSFAASRLQAVYNEAAWASEQTGGVSYLLFVRELARRVDQDWPGVLVDLERMHGLLLQRGAMLCNVTVDAAGWRSVEPQLAGLLAELPAGGSAPATWPTPAATGGEGLTIPAQVNFVAKGADVYAHGYRLHGSAAVAANLLRIDWHLDQIRVKGGAYSAFLTFDTRSGLLAHGSYRDPNLLKTLQVYDRAGEFLRQADLSRSELTRNIIGVISGLDAYQLPDAKGFTSLVRHLVGDTDAFRQQYRDEVLGTTMADIRAFAEALDIVRAHGRVVVIGGQAALEQAAAERPGLFTVSKLL